MTFVLFVIETPRRQPMLLDPQELRYVSSQMRDMNGPLSYYRTTKVRFEEEQGS